MTQIVRPLYLGDDLELRRMGPDDGIMVGSLNVGPPAGDVLDIVDNEVTVTHTWHRLRAAGTAAERQLHRIHGGTAGDVVYLQSSDDSDAFTVRDEVAGGNLVLAGNYSLGTNPKRIIQLLYNGTNWIEVARSTN